MLKEQTQANYVSAKNTQFIKAIKEKYKNLEQNCKTDRENRTPIRDLHQYDTLQPRTDRFKEEMKTTYVSPLKPRQITNKSYEIKQNDRKVFMKKDYAYDIQCNNKEEERSKSKQQRVLNREYLNKDPKVDEKQNVSRVQCDGFQRGRSTSELTPVKFKSKRLDYETIRCLQNDASPIKRFFDSTSTKMTPTAKDTLHFQSYREQTKNLTTYKKNDLQSKQHQRSQTAKIQKQKNMSSINSIDNIMKIIKMALVQKK